MTREDVEIIYWPRYLHKVIEKSIMLEIVHMPLVVRKFRNFRKETINNVKTLMRIKRHVIMAIDESRS